MLSLLSIGDVAVPTTIQEEASDIHSNSADEDVTPPLIAPFTAHDLPLTQSASIPLKQSASIPPCQPQLIIAKTTQPALSEPTAPPKPFSYAAMASAKKPLAANTNAKPVTCPPKVLKSAANETKPLHCQPEPSAAPKEDPKTVVVEQSPGPPVTKTVVASLNSSEGQPKTPPAPLSYAAMASRTRAK